MQTISGLSIRPAANNNTNLSPALGSPYIQILRGRDGRDGRDGERGDRGEPGIEGPRGETGEQGPPGAINGGVTYTRWGKTSCPTVSGTELVYSGITAGSWYADTGGGANYLCIYAAQSSIWEIWTWSSGTQPDIWNRISHRWWAASNITSA